MDVYGVVSDQVVRGSLHQVLVCKLNALMYRTVYKMMQSHEFGSNSVTSFDDFDVSPTGSGPCRILERSTVKK